MKQVHVNVMVNTDLDQREFENLFKHWIDSNGWNYNGVIGSKRKIGSVASWSEEDDLILAETVLKHIRENRTMKEAYNNAADRIQRSSGACEKRWNSFTQHKYQNAILIAKSQAERNKTRKG